MKEMFLAVVDPFFLDVFEKREEEGRCISLFEIAPLSVLLFKRNGIYNSVSPLKHLLPPLFGFLTVFLGFSGGKAVRRVISTGFSAGLCYLIGEKGAGFLQNVHINVPGACYMLCIWENELNCS